MLRSLFLAFAVCCSSAIAEINVTTAKANAVVGLVNPRIVGDRLLVDDGSNPGQQPGAIITVSHQAKFVRVKARRTLFDSVAIEKLTETQWLIVGAGKYLIEVSTFDPETGLDERTLELVVGDVLPPPDPIPTPVPPGPNPPQPDDNVPIKDPGFRVVVIYETETLSSMPAAQQQILYAKEVREYLNAKCVRNANRVAEYRFLDQHANCTFDSKILCQAMQRPRNSLPWIIVSNGTQGYEGPLPANVPETLTLLKKYGGE